jgi:hypothetical protein
VNNLEIKVVSNKTWLLVLATFLVSYGLVLLIINTTDFMQKNGGVLSNFLGVLLGSTFAGSLWTTIQKSSFTHREKIKLTLGCVALSVVLELVRLSVLTSIANAFAFLPILLVGQVAVGGFVILAGLSLGNWFVLKQKGISPQSGVAR